MTYGEIVEKIATIITDNVFERTNNDDKFRYFYLGDIDDFCAGYKMVIRGKDMDHDECVYWLYTCDADDVCGVHWVRKSILAIDGGTMKERDIANTILGALIKNRMYTNNKA